jgi:small subunit ribosomal protein S17
MARPRKKTEEETPDAPGAAPEAEAPQAEAQEAEEPASAEEPVIEAEEPAAEETDEQPSADSGEERAAAVTAEAEIAAPEPPADEVVEVQETDDEAGTERAGAVVEPEPAAEAPPAPPAAPARTKRRSPLTRAEKKAKRAARPKRPTEKPAGRKPIVRLPKPEHARGQRKERRGVVVSSAMDKTIVVRVEMLKPDRRYKKVVRRSNKFHAHDERNEAHVGDIVRIVETRPLSKTKNWRLAEVLQAAK